MNWFLTCIVSLQINVVFAQFSDSFMDSNFTSNPVWNGDTASFTISSGLQLRLNAPSSGGISTLSTSSTAIMNGTWKFEILLDFNPSSSNFAKVYLVSTHSTLTDPLKGYFVKIGGHEDEVSLYYQNGYNETNIINGKDKRIDRSPVHLNIQVNHYLDGSWELFSDSLASFGFISEGLAFHDSLLSSSFFGVYCNYTSSRSDKFYFNNFRVTGTPFLDTIPPMFQEVKVINAHTIKLFFSEPIDLSILSSTSNYLISHKIGNPLQATIDSLDLSNVELSFSSSFPENTKLELLILNMTDSIGNMEDSIITSFELKVAGTADFHDVGINEIFPDPEPSIGLPEVEYIELFNRSDKIINLQHWTISDPTKSGLFPSQCIYPGEYLIVSSIVDSMVLSNFGRVIPISSFPGLNNGGDMLTLMDSNLNIIDRVHYSSHWYSNEKSDGGWSLEKINPYYNCNDENNWTVSTNPFGGSPGMINSVFDSAIDQQRPLLSQIVVIDDQLLQLTFNVMIDTSFEHYAIRIGRNDTLLIQQQIEFTSNQPEIQLDLHLPPGDQYWLSVAGLKDCYGNQKDISTLNFVVPSVGKSQDVIINEVLFNPRTGGSDFVEIYNRSNQFIDLYDWKLANYDVINDSIDNIKRLSSIHTLMPPETYVVFSKDTNNMVFEYPWTGPRKLIQSDLPNYNNAQGNVILLNTAKQVIDRFDYFESMHFRLLTNFKGVSLERIHYNRPTNDLTNWHSASQKAGFGTPGYQNSQFTSNTSKSTNFFLSPELFSPDNDGTDDVLNIHYLFESPGYIGSITVYDIYGREVRLLNRNSTFSAAGIVSWDGLNNNGKKATIGIYVIYLKAFKLNQQVVEIKLPCVLGHQLD